MTHFSVSETPSDWRVVRLGEVVKMSSGGTPSKKHPSYYGGHIPWVKIGDLTDGVVERTESTITEEGLNASSAKWIPAGSVLIAMYGSIAKLGVLGMNATTNQAICAMQPGPEMARDYLYWYLLSQREQLLARGRGGAQSNIGQGDLKALELLLPPVTAQHSVVERIRSSIEQVEAGERALRSALEGSAQLRRAVLHTAFSGEVA